MAKEKCAKESWRHGDSRGGPPRCALFANIGVPGTAVPGSCICSGLPVANCLRQLCPLGTRSLSAQASSCGSPFGAASSSVRFAHPPGKRLLLPILTAGLAMSRAVELASLRIQSCALGARLFPPSKWAGLFPSAAYRRSAPAQLAAGRLTPCGVNCFLPVDYFAWQENEGLHFPAVGGGQAHPLQVGKFQCSWEILQRG